jgi:hypothetical protein
MSQCFMQWRIPILVWYVQVRPFTHQQLQKYILQVTTVLQSWQHCCSFIFLNRSECWSLLGGDAVFQMYCRITERLILVLSRQNYTLNDTTAHPSTAPLWILQYHTVLSVTESLNFGGRKYHMNMDCEVSAQYYTLSCPHTKMYSLKYRISLCFI